MGNGHENRHSLCGLCQEGGKLGGHGRSRRLLNQTRGLVQGRNPELGLEDGQGERKQKECYERRAVLAYFSMEEKTA